MTLATTTTTTGEYGSISLELQAEAGGGSGYVHRVFTPVSADDAVLAFWVNFPEDYGNYPLLCALYSDDGLIEQIRLTVSGRDLRCYRGGPEGTGTLLFTVAGVIPETPSDPASTRFELYVLLDSEGVTGSVLLRMNGAQIGSYSGPTRAGGSGTIDAFALGSSDNGPNSTFFDNVELLSTGTGAVKPPNDHFADAIEILDEGLTAPINNELSTIETGEPNTGSTSHGTLWWKYTPEFDGEIRIDTFDTVSAVEGVSTPDTWIGVYTGTALNNLVEIVTDDDSAEDPEGFYRSKVTFNGTAGVTYYIQVGSYASTVEPLDVVVNLELAYSAAKAVDDNSIGGRNRGGIGYARWDPPVAALHPAQIDVHNVVRARAYSSVAINPTTGRVTEQHSEVAVPRHRERILINNVDFTFFRGVPTPIPTWENVEPLGYGPATMELPQVKTYFESPGKGHLAILKPGATVRVQRIDENDNPIVPDDYRGRIVSFDSSSGPLRIAIGGELTGPASLLIRPTPIVRRLYDVGAMASAGVRAVGLPFSPARGLKIGIDTYRFGGMTQLAYLQQLCDMSWTRAGAQWIIMPQEPDRRVYEMRQKDLTTIHATAYLDGQHVTQSLTRDIAEEPNSIYMTGVTPQGMRVRFGAYPGLKQGEPAPYPMASNASFGIGTTNAQTVNGDGISVMINRLRITKYMDGEDVPGGFDEDVAEAIKELKRDAGIKPRTGVMTPRA